MVAVQKKGVKTRNRHRLRIDAEKRLARMSEKLSHLSEKSSEEIIHELQVHQIELEIQNEELKRAHLDLEEVKDRFLDVFDFAPVGYFILSEKALINEVNLTGAAMLRIERKYLLHDRFRKFVSPDDFDHWDHFFLAILKGDEQQTTVIKLKPELHSHIYTRMTGIRLNRAGEQIQIRIAMNDITDWKNAEDALHESEKKFRLVVESAPDAIFIQIEGMFAYLNPAACRLFGASSDKQLIGMPVVAQFHPKFHDIVRERIRILNEDKKPVPIIEEIIVQLDNTPVDVEVTAVSFRYLQKDGALVFARDVSQRKQSEDTIRFALEEKEILLQEVHHRVKNNLAVIISLIAMQEDQVTERRTQEQLQDLKSRVTAIALVHESLFKSKNLSQINFLEYLDYLINYIVYSLSHHCIPKMTVDVENIHLGPDIAIPCGLIINELITNSIKYAFPAGTPPENGKDKPCLISIKFRNSDGYLCLQVSDNGIGIGGDISDVRSSKTLGLRLVSMLVTHQLRGTVELDTQNGTAFTILFKQPEMGEQK